MWDARSVRWWLRAAGIGWTLLFLVWLGIEDLSANTAVWMAAAACAWAGVRWAAARDAAPGLAQRLGLGALLGGSVVFIALGLMAVKNGLHLHAAPEYTYRQVAAVLWQGIWWALGGLALAGSWALLADAQGAGGARTIR